MTFVGKIEGGKLHLFDRAVFQRLVDNLEGAEVEIKLARRRRTRSNVQNSYYWGVVVKEISDYTGHTPEEIHEAMKWRFLRSVDDHGIELAASSANLTTERFAKFVDQVIQFAQQELELRIPEAA